MFDDTSHVFALPPGVDFPAALVAGLRARLTGQPPEAMARVTLYLNTQRMRRRVSDLFAASGAGFLPRLRLVTDLGQDAAFADLPAAPPPLRLRLQLSQLVAGLLGAQPDLAPRAALYDLSDSLADLMGEMQGEGVAPATVAALDVSDHSAHWRRTQQFLGIIAPFFDGPAPPDAEARQRRVVERLAAQWALHPPLDPMIIAGSTGSRGTTALLMQAVARLPQGALVLPGFDPDLSPAIWGALDDALSAEDHPQYRFRKLMTALYLSPADITPWHAANAANPARNRLISLSLRPAPVTDQWLTEGKLLPDLTAATAEMTLIEAPSPRAEALAIALILRQVAESGRTAALITPDRNLTRQVTAALDRWAIRPDDSAGRPLGLSAPGRLLRHVSRLFGQRLRADGLLTLLKHPLTATGADRGRHLRWTRELELKLRRNGPPFPTGADLIAWAATQTDPEALLWAGELARALEGVDEVTTRPLAEHVAHHRALTEAFARGTGDSAGTLWQEPAGEAALALIEELIAEASHGGALSPADYTNLFDALLTRGEVRDPVQPHPRIMIWGTLEARVQGADLVILGGLNDGTWPKLPPPDPWLNRKMRLDAGLLLPERRIGLAAHDYQQAIAAPEVILTRAHRNADAETVPSRWVNRLVNLLGGLPAQHGPQALAAMRARGQHWLALAEALERPEVQVAPARRPSPRPPVAARPATLAVTGIRTLIRDPYAIYARHILRLYPLDPLRPGPDARLRGQVLHLILERFIKDRPMAEDLPAARARLLATAATVMAEEAPWPAARALWQARMERAAGFFLRAEAARGGTPVVLEERGRAPLGTLPFILTARPDRIDVLPEGRIHILDYKTGAPPTKKQQAQFDKQLLLEAAMVAKGAFGPNLPTDVARISYIGLGATPKIEETEITPDLIGTVWQDLHALIGRYLSRAQGYASRRAVFEDRFPGDYDHLARYGEWQMTDRPEPQDVG